jgi:hypothetical protein
MGLLNKAAVKLVPPLDYSREEIYAVIYDYQKKNSMFHCVVLGGNIPHDKNLLDVAAAMTAHYGPVCRELRGGNCLVLLPKALDMELFSHRLSKSTNSTVLFQCSAGIAGIAFEAVKPYL